MVKWTFAIILSFLNLSSTVSITNSNVVAPINEMDVCNANNKAFQAGEKLKYKIYYNWGLLWLAAGEVVFSIEDDGDNYLYTAVGKSYRSYSWIFDVDDYFYSYVDKQTLLPKRAMRDINEGGYIIHNNIEFDQDERLAVSTVKINEKEPKTIEKEFDYCMYDILSVIYSLRNVDKSSLKKGDQIPFAMMLDDEIYPLNMEYIGSVGQKKVRHLGKINAVKLSPSVIKGRVFAKNKRMKVWISDDQNNVPLIIESPLAIGKIKVVLQKYEGLRYPLNGKD